MSEELEIREELKEIVIMRIEAIPSNLKLSIGDDKTLTKEEMIKHVKEEDSIGMQIINSHVSFMKAVARGDFTKAITTI